MDNVVAVLQRSGVIESKHFGQVAIVRDGNVEFEFGGNSRIVPRSALKPLQSVAMLRAGLPVRGRQLALATASHSGEIWQQNAVTELLNTYDLRTSDLQLPSAAPLGIALGVFPGPVSDANLSAPSQVANNCSGQHAAMLITCKINGWPREDYISVDHPLQKVIASTIGELTSEEPCAPTIDGCGLTIPSVTPAGLARAFDKIGRAHTDTAEGRVANAMREWPDWVAGPGRNSTRWMAAHPGVLVKDGAEGVAAATTMDGTAVAIKIWDGAPRACRVMLAAFFTASGLSVPPECAREFAVSGGTMNVGELRPVVDLGARNES